MKHHRSNRRTISEIIFRAIAQADSNSWISNKAGYPLGGDTIEPVSRHYLFGIGYHCANLLLSY